MGRKRRENIREVRPDPKEPQIYWCHLRVLVGWAAVQLNPEVSLASHKQMLLTRVKADVGEAPLAHPVAAASRT